MGTTTDDFFKEQKEKSRVKSLIVTEFFAKYLSIISNGVGKDKPIFYIDLFAGPGYYDNGVKSTPILIMDELNKYNISNIPDIRLIFNDQNSECYEKLCKNITSHPAYIKLRNKPIISNTNASDVGLDQYIERRAPIFSFIDPWGYIDVSYTQLWSLVKNIGSDNILFFNTKRINEDINKPSSVKHMMDLFGSELNHAQKICSSNYTQREKMEGLVLCFSKNIYQIVKGEHQKIDFFVLPFNFKSEQKEFVSHYIIFITKNHKAVSEMKSVMVKHNTSYNGKLGFDAKDVDRLTFFRREDDVNIIISKVIKDVFSQYPSLLNNKWNIEHLLYAMDKYYMSKYYITTPLTRQDLKKAMENFNKEGLIEIIRAPDAKRFINRITNNGEFKLKSRILEIL